jgi:hypothetical protein
MEVLYHHAKFRRNMCNGVKCIKNEKTNQYRLFFIYINHTNCIIPSSESFRTDLGNFLFIVSTPNFTNTPHIRGHFLKAVLRHHKFRGVTGSVSAMLHGDVREARGMLSPFRHYRPSVHVTYLPIVMRHPIHYAQWSQPASKHRGSH